MTELIGVREAARRLGVHENTVRNWVRSGYLQAYQRFPESGYTKFTAREVDRVRAEMEADADRGRALAEWPRGATIGVLVRLRLPPGMTPAQAVREVARGVAFGHPDVSLHFVVPDPDSSGQPGDQEDSDEH